MRSACRRATTGRRVRRSRPCAGEARSRRSRPTNGSPNVAAPARTRSRRRPATRMASSGSASAAREIGRRRCRPRHHHVAVGSSGRRDREGDLGRPATRPEIVVHGRGPSGSAASRPLPSGFDREDLRSLGPLPEPWDVEGDLPVLRPGNAAERGRGHGQRAPATTTADYGAPIVHSSLAHTHSPELEAKPGTRESQQPPTNYPSAMAKAAPRPGNVESSHPGIAPDVGPDDPRRFTDSGIEIQTVYDERGRRRPRPRRAPRRAGRVPVHARHPSRDVPLAALDDAPVRGLRDRAGDQHPLPVPAREGLDRPLDGVRPADAARARLRRPAVPRRGRAHRRRDRLDRRHADGLRPDPARPGLDLDDDQRAGRDPAAAVRAGRRGAGRARRAAARHGAERHPQGVRRARELHLPARGRDAPHDRHLRLLPQARPEVEHDLDLGLPHAREGLLGGAGGRVHALERDRVRAGRDRRRARGRRVRAPARVLLQRPQQRLPGGGQVPGGAARCGPRSCATASARRTRAPR